MPVYDLKENPSTPKLNHYNLKPVCASLKPFDVICRLCITKFWNPIDALFTGLPIIKDVLVATQILNSKWKVMEMYTWHSLTIFICSTYLSLYFKSKLHKLPYLPCDVEFIFPFPLTEAGGTGICDSLWYSVWPGQCFIYQVLLILNVHHHYH